MAAMATTRGPSTFGAGLRQWRVTRGMSQLDLAHAADVSQRHVSFLETGRSRPSREMVLHLGRALDVPLREQNVLLTAAGHPPAFSETALDRLGEVERALRAMLDCHEPHMAVVVDRRWNVVMSNDAATRFLARVIPEPPEWLTARPNLMRLAFHPDGLRRVMDRWHEPAVALLRRLERDVASFPSDDGLRGLLSEVREYPGVSDLTTPLGPPTAEDPVLPATYRVDGEPISLFTTTSTIGGAHDLTLAELRIETFWPVDGESARRWIAHFGDASA
jgi:transcriptional regulator with XRE-family HTH domain